MNPALTTLPNGQWVITHDTHLSKWAVEHGSIITDPSLFKFLAPFMENVTVVWDIGANIGDHTRQYLDWGKQVVAVEPNPLAFECLKHNCPDARLLNAAASDTPRGSLQFMRLDNVGASRVNPSGDITVPTIILDDLTRDSPAPQFIKIDVEGWELAALKGASHTIGMYRPMIFCEINAGALESNGVTPSELIAWIEDRLGACEKHFYPVGAKLGDPQFDILFTPTT